jgi:hypothetical protein
MGIGRQRGHCLRLTLGATTGHRSSLTSCSRANRGRGGGISRQFRKGSQAGRQWTKKNPQAVAGCGFFGALQISLDYKVVPTAGLEPARVSPLPPQDSVSTSSTTSAFFAEILLPTFSLGGGREGSGLIGLRLRRHGDGCRAWLLFRSSSRGAGAAHDRGSAGLGRVIG